MRKKRVWAILLSLVMIVTALCPVVNAESANEELPFTDVSSSQWFHDAVTYVYNNGMMNGTSDTTFEPDSGLTRAMFVTILGRMAGVSEKNTLVSHSNFSDVNFDQWYTFYVNWAAGNSITKGISESEFGVNQLITREQMATIISRYVESQNSMLPDADNPVSGFKDADRVSSWAKDGLELMRKSGIIRGDAQGNFNPSKSATRAEAATIFMRLKQAEDRVFYSWDTVIFGNYEQDNDLTNGKEPIEWIVLKKEKGKALLLSKYALDKKPYNNYSSDGTWETCSLRKWLNETFLAEAFDSSQQDQILTTLIQNPDTYYGHDSTGNPLTNNTGEGITDLRYRLLGGNATNDKVFLLNVDEAKNLLGYQSKKYKDYDVIYPNMQTSATAYANNRISDWAKPGDCLTIEGEIACAWWLRSTVYQNHSLDVGIGGCADSSDFYGGISEFSYPVRPAIWVDLDLVEDPVQYQVFFDAEGGSVSQSSKMVKNGYAYGTLPTPERKGYVFDGWYTSPNSGNKVTNTTTVDLTANQILYAHWVSIAVGDIMKFGSYEQDNDTSNGKESIEWIVLKKENGKALLLSKYGLDCQKYNDTNTSVTWASCTLRTWLNETFFNEAFNVNQRKQIQTTSIQNAEDKVFLLSVDEVKNLLESKSPMRTSVTAYAKAKGAYTSTDYMTTEKKPSCWWWLRSSENEGKSAMNVGSSGNISSDIVNYSHNAVRPAVWVDLEN